MSKKIESSEDEEIKCIDCGKITAHIVSSKSKQPFLASDAVGWLNFECPECHNKGVDE